MKRSHLFIGSALISILVAATVFAVGPGRIREFLRGYEEVPAVSTGASAVFNARIRPDESRIDYELSYSALEGAVQQSHIHLGQKGANGGITIFLCSNLGNGPAGTQACPNGPATISGTITPADVSPPIPATAAARAQGLDTGEWDEFLAALRAGVTYVNLHSTKFPGGEIRSQIDLNHGEHNGEPSK
jgi:hypothetical protein